MKIQWLGKRQRRSSKTMKILILNQFSQKPSPQSFENYNIIRNILYIAYIIKDIA